MGKVNPTFHKDPKEFEKAMGILFPGWWFRMCFILTLPGEMIQFDKYVSSGWKPPTRFCFFLGRILEDFFPQIGVLLTLGRALREYSKRPV